MWRTPLRDRGKMLYAYLLGILLLICISMLCTGPSSKVASAHTLALRHSSVASEDCPSPAIPDADSLLIVLLDRSGSLVFEPGATDPDDYSTSAVKALADLWPGKMAVIPFGNDAAPILGPVAVSDVHTREALKSQIPEPDPNANTPLGLAMENAKKLFQQQGVTACSKVVLITDGQPTGPQGRADNVKNKFIPWFHDQGIPIHVFGLKIDKNTDDGKAADRLLTAIAQGTGTGSTYDSVRNAQDLAREVIGLYSSWRHLDFTKVDQDTADGNYHVVVDQFVHDTAYIITFHAQDIPNKPLTTSSGDIVPTNTVELSGKDRHYEIDRLLPPVLPKAYIVNTGGDSQAFVYKLVSSTLVLQGIEPTLTTQAYTGQSLLIQARFVDGTEPQHPKSGDAKVTAYVTEIVNGTSMDLGTVKLTQSQPGDDIFSGYVNIPPKAFGHRPGSSIGTIQIKVDGTYLDATRTAVFPGVNGDSISIPLLVPTVGTPLPPKCTLPAWQCFMQKYQTPILIFTPLVLLLLLLLIIWWLWQRQPTPFGSLHNVAVPMPIRRSSRKQDTEDKSFVMALGAHRTLPNQLFSRSVITSKELQDYPDVRGKNDLDGVNFTLVSKYSNADDTDKANNHQKAMFIRKPADSAAEIAIKTQTRPPTIETVDAGQEHKLKDKDIIIINQVDFAQFSSS